MTIQVLDIELATDPDYQFIVPLEGVSYLLRLYYNERLEQWVIDLLTSGDDPIVLGAGIVPEYPLFVDYGITNLSGFFWLQPIGKNQNETVQNPFDLKKYYDLWYVYDDGEPDISSETGG